MKIKNSPDMTGRKPSRSSILFFFLLSRISCSSFCLLHQKSRLSDCKNAYFVIKNDVDFVALPFAYIQRDADNIPSIWDEIVTCINVKVIMGI